MDVSVSGKDYRISFENDGKVRRLSGEMERFRNETPIRFDLTLTADEIVRRLEKQREEHMPKTPDEPWSEAFCEAVTVLPEARAFADDCWMECMEVRKD